jgi:hypothetical protein
LAGKKNKKIVKYRKPMNLNVGMIIFAIIFVYMSFNVYTYIKKEKIQFYEVVEGNIVNDHQYTGIALRTESVQNTEYAGYINYYVREGKRAGIGTRIYSIDETGSLSGALDLASDSALTLTDSNIVDVKRQLVSFSTGWSDMDFDDVYDLQSTLEASVLEYVNFNAVGNLDSLMEESGATFQQVRAPQSGVVSYAIDGFENIQAEQINAEAFTKTGYERAITKAGQEIAANAPVYKLVTSNNWSVVFPLSEKDVEEYGGKASLHVTFLSNDLETEGDFSIITGSDGASYGKLDFDKYMVQFVADRFIRFEVDSDRVAGLKIPVTAVTSKNFYLVPVSYMTTGGDSSDTGFMKESYSENGTSVDFVPTTIYYSTDEYCYIDMSDKAQISAGDYLVRPDSTDRYQVGQSASLQGVYNINKGYAVFKQIEILNSNDEYYTIRKGMNYGLSVYDHIVLNADTVYEGELVYQ